MVNKFSKLFRKFRFPHDDKTLKTSYEVMKTIALPKELGGKGFIMTVEVIYVRRCSSKTNKLRYVHSIWGAPWDITIKDWEMNYIKNKIVPCIINFSGYCTIKYW